ncbi:MAG: hypothetical protein HW384_328 [Dehalococcoidia bacterium]|nr:hypothetical protein [Dehalococcoidia bacterium]MBF8303823.1 hypothetical protein [Dehalococcoidia bacterium]
MSLDRLIKDGSIHLFKATPEEITRAMDIAHRDLTDSERILTESLDWSYSIAYNAVLQACRAYMFHRGYRPAGGEKHKATLAFMQISVDPELTEIISYFDRVRKKRNRVIYDEVGLVSENEARHIIQKAKEFIAWVDTQLKTK